MSDIHIEEKKAPTDESVRLLSEMEAAAEKRVIGRTKIENNVFMGELIQMSSVSRERIIILRFELNGTEYSEEISMGADPLCIDRDDLFKGVYKMLSEKIAELLMIQELRKLAAINPHSTNKGAN